MNERSETLWSPGFTLADRFQTRSMLVGSWACDGTRVNPGTDEVASYHQIWMQRVGSHSLEIAGCRLTADPLTVIFHNAGDEYRSSSTPHVQQESTVVLLSETVVAELLRAVERDDGGFPVVAVPLDSGATLSRFQLQSLLRHRERASPLEIEERTLALAEQLLQGAKGANRSATPDTRSSRTRRAHRELVGEARHFLVQNFFRPVLLEDIGRAVAASPYHLSRLFTQEMGIPIHRYLTRLRLQAALECIDGGGVDLSRVALGVGFSSHSHFTTTFRREFGEIPSQIREKYGAYPLDTSV